MSKCEKTLDMFPPISRKNAPATSEMAGDNLTKSGKRISIAMKVSAAVKQHPNSTAAELAALPELKSCSMNPLNTVRSRLSELQDDRYPDDLRVKRSESHRQCSIHKTMQVTWSPFKENY
jgi:hypothetical protein